MHEIFPWNSNFETGVPAIDEQHKRLVELINLLAMHVAYQASELTLEKALLELEEYVKYHFATEEKLMHHHLADDPMVQEHEATHRAFEEELARFKADRSQKPADQLFEEILSYLSHWLAFHILESDKRMAKVVLAVEEGNALDAAKVKAGEAMAGWMKVLVETILSMYDSLSSRTLELMREINERKRAEERLRLAASVYENTLEAIFVTDAEANIIEVNPSFSQYTGYGREEAIGVNLKVLRTGLRSDEAKHIWQKAATEGHWSGEIRNRNKDGELMPEWLTLSAIRDESGAILNYVGLFTNVSQLVQRQHQLESFAHFDTLTGLPNRLLLIDRLQQAIARAKRDKRYLAVCYLDLDEFKPVNDTYGHAAGDILLKEIADRVHGILRENDTFARMGGDEFILLIGDLATPEESRVFLERVLKEIEKPVLIRQQPVTVSASIGITFFSKGGDEPHLLLQQADQAMYCVKQSGKAGYAFFDSQGSVSEALSE